MKIITNHVFPPIPIRTCDWSAVTDNYEPGHPIGMGATEQEAIADLKEQLACDRCGQPVECGDAGDCEDLLCPFLEGQQQ